MSTAFAETSSQLAESEFKLQTGGIRDNEWLWPEIEPSERTEGETTAKLPPPSSDTARASVQSIASSVPAPIRKDRILWCHSDSRVKLLQQWECIVFCVHHGYVECEMHDLTDESKPVEQAELYLEEFSHYDRPLLQEGAVFYWSIGHETQRTGQVRRYSELRVRRMPPLGRLRKREISREAERISEVLNKHR
jgi:hypothetical protein